MRRPLVIYDRNFLLSFLSVLYFGMFMDESSPPRFAGLGWTSLSVAGGWISWLQFSMTTFVVASRYLNFFMPSTLPTPLSIQYTDNLFLLIVKSTVLGKKEKRSSIMRDLYFFFLSCSLCVYQLTEAGGGEDVGVEVLLCMRDGGAIVSCVCTLYNSKRVGRHNSGSNRVHILMEMKQGECICPLSLSVHCNFVRDGKYGERGWACTPTLTRLG